VLQKTLLTVWTATLFLSYFADKQTHSKAVETMHAANNPPFYINIRHFFTRKKVIVLTNDFVCVPHNHTHLKPVCSRKRVKINTKLYVKAQIK